MFGKLFGRKKPTPKPDPGPQLGMLMLRSLDGVTGDRIASAWAELFPELPALKRNRDDAKGGEGVFGFNVGGQTLFLAVMPVPIPHPEINDAVESSWMWSRKDTSYKEQKAHAIATATPLGTPVTDALAVSRLLAAAAKASDSIGIYWGNARLVHKAPLFIDAVKDFGGGESLPVMMWVGLAISGKSANGPFTLTTHGLNHFGHREFEIIDTSMGIGDLRMLAYRMSEYVLQKGPVLKHGDTFGGSAEERIKVEHTTSRFRKGEPVVRLLVP
jgi:hypothetical protein